MADFGKSATAVADKPAATQGKSIVDLISADSQFKMFASAVQKSGMAEKLRGAGPFTVFAPTDAAFAKLPEGSFESQTADKAKLAKLVGNHIVPKQVLAADLKTMADKDPKLMVQTVDGRDLPIRLNGPAVHIGDRSTVTVTKPDLMASNGVIHAIDGILTLPS